MTSQPFQAIKVSDRVHWVGAIDWNLRDFHGYLTARGTTYNAYLIVADKITLVDTVRRPFLDEMLSRISSVVDPSRIDTIISNHAELDHAGCLPEMVARVHPDKILTSKTGVGALAEHFALNLPVEAVTSGSSVEIGQARLSFQDTRMLHWPESMVSFLEGDDVLFSQDAFGMHLASHERFSDEIPPEVVDYELRKYFANIFMPFAASVGKVIGKLDETLKKAKVVATDHGPIWRKDFDKVLARYRTWVDRVPARKVVIVYDTMWQSTETMARVIAEGATEAGLEARVMRLGQAHRSDVATELLDAAAILVGSPNLNGQMYPTVADLLTYLKGLKPKGLVGAVFGSYGWSPAVAEQLQEALREIKVELVHDPVLVKYVPHRDDLVHCRSLGRAIADRVLSAK